MANELTTTNSTAVDAARARDGVDRLYASIERDRWGQDRLPALLTAVQRRDLTERKRDLRSRLRPISMATAEQDRARGAILLFLQGYQFLIRLIQGLLQLRGLAVLVANLFLHAGELFGQFLDLLF